MTRSCIECGRPVRPRDRDRCGRCHRRANPTRACRTCGQHRLIVGLGLCDNCWHQDPDLPFRQAARLAARLQDPPEWLDAFVVYAAARNSVGRTSRMISHLGRLLSDTEPNSPQALLQRARRPGRSIGPRRAHSRTSSSTPTWPFPSITRVASLRTAVNAAYTRHPNRFVPPSPVTPTRFSPDRAGLAGPGPALAVTAPSSMTSPSSEIWPVS